MIKVIHEVVIMSPRSTLWFRRFFIMCTEDDKSSRISQFLIWKLSFSMSWKSQLIFHRCVDVTKWDTYLFLTFWAACSCGKCCMLFSMITCYEWMKLINLQKSSISVLAQFVCSKICRKTHLRSFRPGPTKTRLHSRWSLIVWLAVWTYW